MGLPERYRVGKLRAFLARTIILTRRDIVNDVNDTSSPDKQRESLNVSKTVIILAGSVMVMPALIPLWFAIQADTAQMMLVFGGMSAVLVVVNLLVLYVIYRWLQLF